MVGVTIRGTTFSINRIVAFGCSFTSGTEILDHLLSPRLVALKRVLSAYDWWEEIKKEPEQLALQNELRIQERDHAWPAHLAKMLDVEYMSYAQTGNSNEHMYWQIEQHIANGNLTEHDLILVGTTSPQRAMFFSEHCSAPVPFLFSNTASYTSQLTEHILKWFTDDRIVWNYLRDLQSFDLAKCKLEGRLFIVPMEKVTREICPWPATNRYGTFNSVSNDNATFFNNLIGQQYNSNLFLTTTHCLYDQNDGTTELPHGHLNELAHQRFAQILARNCITKVDI